MKTIINIVLVVVVLWGCLITPIGLTSSSVSAVDSPRQVVVILVDGNNDCCLYRATRLIEGLEAIDKMPEYEIVWAATDSRGSTPHRYEDYTSPWNSLSSFYQSDHGLNIEHGTTNFVNETSNYLKKFPADTPIIIIGFSFGGDSVLEFVRREPVHNFVFVGVIDPVDGGGLRSSITAKRIDRNVDYFFNRWQNNLVPPSELFTNEVVYQVHPTTASFNKFKTHVSGEITCFAKRGCNQEYQDVQKYASGVEKLTEVDNCKKDLRSWWGCATSVLSGEAGEAQPKLLTHSLMPTDDYIQEQMLDAIKQQLALEPNLSGMIYVDSSSSPSNGVYNGSQQAPFPSVLIAKDRALPGATISVSEGFYPESLNINMPVTILGSEGPVYLGAKSGGLNLTGTTIIEPSEPYRNIAPGDVNCDGFISPIDALMIHLVDWQEPPPLCPPLPSGSAFNPMCDLNDDEKCDADDAAIIQNCDVGIGDRSPLCPLVGTTSDSIPQTLIQAPEDEPIDATVSIGSTSLKIGQTGTVPILVEVGATNLGAATVEVRYDPSLVAVKACNVDPDNVFDFEVCNSEFVNDGGSPAVVRFNVLSSTGVSGSLKLANLTLEAKGQSDATTSLDVEIASIKRVGGLPITVANQDGTLQVVGGSAPQPPNSHLIYLPAVQR